MDTAPLRRLGMDSGCTTPVCTLCSGRPSRKYDFGRYGIVYCRTCQLGQLALLPTDLELSALYASRQYFEGTDRVGYTDYFGDAPQFARTFRDKVARLLRYGSVQDLVEVGCGTGYFLLEAQHAGIRNAVGVDRNPWAVEEARRHGLEAHVGSIDAVPRERTFDAVVMLNLIEHVTNPVSFLAEVRARLRPEGRVFIMTPNIRSVLARVSGKRWVSFKIPEHVYYYSPRSIRCLLERAGFDVISCKGTGQYVTVAFLLSRLGRLAPRCTAVLAAAARVLQLHSKVVFVTNGSIDVVARCRPGALPHTTPSQGLLLATRTQ